MTGNGTEEGPAARALVIEDDLDQRHAIAVVLRRMGLTVEEADNAPTALERLESTAADLVVSDLSILSGPLLEAVVVAGAATPLVVISATPPDEGPLQLRRRARCWLRKPFSPADLRSAVRDLVGGAPSHG